MFYSRVPWYRIKRSQLKLIPFSFCYRILDKNSWASYCHTIHHAKSWFWTLHSLQNEYFLNVFHSLLMCFYSPIPIWPTFLSHSNTISWFTIIWLHDNHWLWYLYCYLPSNALFKDCQLWIPNYPPRIGEHIMTHFTKCNLNSSFNPLTKNLVEVFPFNKRHWW